MLKTTGAAVGGLSWVGMINQWSVQLFNVPLTVVGMAAAGTFISFGYGPKAENRRTIYMEALFITFLSVVTVTVLPAILGWQWVKPELQGPFAGFLGVLGRFSFEPLRALFPELLRKVFRLDKTKDENKES